MGGTEEGTNCYRPLLVAMVAQVVCCVEAGTGCIAKII